MPVDGEVDEGVAVVLQQLAGADAPVDVARVETWLVDVRQRGGHARRSSASAVP
jgi:hypothetical protein